MAWPRKGILIRLAIYIPIIGFLAYGAFFRDKDVAEPEASEPEVGKIRKAVGSDGQVIEYLEITPDEAKQMGYPVQAEDPPAAQPDQGSE